MTKKIRVALIQQRCMDVRQDNITTTIDAINKAAAQGSELVLLQELHTSLYFCQTEDVAKFDLAETIPGPSTEIFSQVAKNLRVVIVTSIFEKRATGLYHNTAVVIDKDGIIAGCYRKMHIPDDPGYYEKFYFAPGDLGFKPVVTSVGKLGILVCWDQWYPEAARLMALAGADLLLYPTAIGWGTQESDEDEKKRQRDAWITIQRGHAISNGLPVLVANRVGFESATPQSTQGIHFWGSSFVTGQQGEILAEGPIDQPAIVVTDINLNRNETVRRGWPFLRDRRIESYHEIMRRHID